MSAIQSVGSTNTAPTTGAATGTANSSLSGLASEDTFLKLFTAQLKNQNPLDSQQQDPTQMVTELAQFSQLEQTVNMGQDVHSIAGVVSSASTSAAAAATSPTASSTNPSTSKS